MNNEQRVIDNSLSYLGGKSKILDFFPLKMQFFPAESSSQEDPKAK
jgi:hypothetical protein